MVALRAVGPRNPWLAGASWSWAPPSPITPPTPSTSRVAPISSGATSCTERAKKLRDRRRLTPVLQQRRERSGEDKASDDAGETAGDDGGADARRGCERTGFEISERRRARHLRELDPDHPPAHRIGGQLHQHRPSEHCADQVGAACEREQREGEPELGREPEAGDGGTPDGSGDHDDEPLPADVVDPAAERA